MVVCREGEVWRGGGAGRCTGTAAGGGGVELLAVTPDPLLLMPVVTPAPLLTHSRAS
jgi:hypothetical protein